MTENILYKEGVLVQCLGLNYTYLTIFQRQTSIMAPSFFAGILCLFLTFQSGAEFVLLLLMVSSYQEKQHLLICPLCYEVSVGGKMAHSKYQKEY